MAQSLAHRWGQIIGDVLEHFVRNVLSDVADRNGLYLDFKRPRRARANQTGGDRSKVTWHDGYGNKHDLDYVLERNGSEDEIGTPIAFVESAWRRYTKHSKNKVQEIESAVLPVALTFSRYQPFLGAVLAGEFTGGALSQLQSKGFSLLHIPYDSILAAFLEVGIDASSTDGADGTEESEFEDKIATWEKLDQPGTTSRLIEKWHSLHASEIQAFKQALQNSIDRRVSRIKITVLRGHSVEMPDVDSAINYLVQEENDVLLREDGAQRELFEIYVRFNNDAKIEATFPTRPEAIAFLRAL